MISVVIACYNDDQFVTKAVDSILKQTYKNIEIIVVDDGSNAKTKLVLSTIEPRITKLITQENRGQSIARNNGIKVSKGQLILNLDSDDYFEPEFCEKAVALLSRNEDIRIVTCWANRFSESGHSELVKPRGGSFKNFLFANSALGSSMFRKGDWYRCDGYEENLPILGFEDWELYLNILKTGGRAHVIDEVLFNYQVRVNSTTDRIRSKKLDKFKEIVLKHKDLYLEDFEDLLDHFIHRVKQEEFQVLKTKNKLDFRLGQQILNPIRKIKSIAKKRN